MSTRRQWLWGELSPAQLEFADAFAGRLLANAAGLPQPRYSHTPDEHQQKLLGAQGEIAFRVITGRRLPSIDELSSTWKGADVDGWIAVKTVSQPTYRLVFDDSDLETARALVLVYADPPRFTIVGWLSAPRARRSRRWGHYLPRPAWTVEQHDLDPWPRCSGAP